MATDGWIRHFGGLLQSLEDGQLINDCGESLHELVAKLQREAGAVGKAKGELCLKLKLAADGAGIVQIDGEVTIKAPKPARQRTVMWTTKDGRLTAENPRQTKLPLREVPAAREDVKEAPQVAGGEVRSV